MPAVDEKAVLYVDMLGFSALTEKFPVETADFAVVDRPNKKDFLRVKFEALGNNKLIEHYTKFNMAVDDAVDWELLSEDRLTVISFSDSAFIAVDSVYTAISMGRGIVTRLLRERIPVRCAVAFGSFVVLRFRSDLSLRAGTHAAQFLGTGVVWSHAAAELSRIKGMRILLHSSAAGVLDRPEHAAPAPDLAHVILPLPPEERQNPARVTLEVSHLNGEPNNWDKELWDDVTAMKTEAPEAAQMHHVATLDSINRMRQALGREPL